MRVRRQLDIDEIRPYRLTLVEFGMLPQSDMGCLQCGPNDSYDILLFRLGYDSRRNEST
jgi:hypothetical protein